MTNLSNPTAGSSATTSAPPIALCVGHSRLRGDGTPEGGAIAADGKTSEWQYCRALALIIQARLRGQHGIESVVIDHYGPGGYNTAMRALRHRLLRMPSVEAAVELNFNSGTATANGHEWLYWRESRDGHALATALNRIFSRDIKVIKPRGVKPRGGKDRGAGFLRETPCPAVIAEPFFGSHAGDWRVARDNANAIAVAIADGIVAWRAGAGGARDSR